MNIFFTDKCPVKCAEFLDDKRVIKMCLETAQLLATALWEHGSRSSYRPTHKNHPSAIWARATKSNYEWTVKHFQALCNEYTKRYGKVHASLKLLQEFLEGIDIIPDGELTEFANCAANQSIGVSYKHLDDVCVAYQLYLNDRWDNDKREPTWYGEKK